MGGIVSTRKSGDVHRLGMIQWPIPAEISAPPVAQPGGPISAQRRAKTPKAHSEPPTISWSWPPISVQNRHLWYFVTDGIFAILALSTLSSGAGWGRAVRSGVYGGVVIRGLLHYVRREIYRVYGRVIDRYYSHEESEKKVLDPVYLLRRQTRKRNKLQPCVPGDFLIFRSNSRACIKHANPVFC